MTEKRFTITQNGDNFTVRDNLKKRPMGMFEFKQDEFPVYFCFHKIIDLLNQLDDENKQLKKQISNLEHTRDFCVDICADCKRLEEENEQLKCKIELLQNEIDMLNGKGIEFKSITDLENKYHTGDGE